MDRYAVALAAGQSFAASLLRASATMVTTWDAQDRPQETPVRPLLMRFIDDRSGATAIEYALIAAGIAMVMIAALQALGVTTAGKLQPIAVSIQQAGQ
jgi:pilus assembly protein Flp/PilA